MKKMLLFVVLAVCLGLPAFAQTTPTITGTWTGTSTVNSDLGLVNLTVTLVVSSQSGGNFTGAVTIDTGIEGAGTVYGRIDSILSLWQLHAAGLSGYNGAIRVQGFYTPAVPLVSVATITMDGEGMYGAWLGSPQLFDAPYCFHVTLTKS